MLEFSIIFLSVPAFAIRGYYLYSLMVLEYVQSFAQGLTDTD